MKKLLLINPKFLPIIGGGETYTIELMRYFSKKWEVHLITQERGFNKSEWKNCKIHYIEEFDDNNLNIFKCIPHLRKLLTKINPDLVHIHNLIPFFIFSTVTHLNEFPTVLTIHNTPNIPQRLFGSFNDFESECIFARQLLLNNRCNKIIFGSNFYLDNYAKVVPLIKDKKAEVIHYFPPELTKGSLKSNRSFNSSDNINILFPSRVVKRKGIEEAIAALAKLPQKFKLTLPAFAQIDDLNYKIKIKDMIARLNLQNRVSIPKKIITHTTMKSFYQNSDVVIIPSHYEGFGIVAVEALSWGVPVIASETGGLKEIIKNNHNGLTIRPGNTHDLVKAIHLLASNKKLVNKLTSVGIKTVKNKFSLQSHMTKIENIYLEVLAN